MKHTSSLLFACLSLLLWQCETKEDPLSELESSSNSPLFWLSGEIEGESYTWTAGEDGYILSPSTAEGSMGGAKFEQADCISDCGPSIGVTWKQHENAPQTLTSDSILNLAAGEVAFFAPAYQRPIEVKVRFYAEPLGKHNNNIKWEFSDGQQTHEENPLMVFKPSEEEPFIQACLTVANLSGDSSILCNTINLLNDCRQEIAYESFNQSAYLYTTQPGYQGSVLWEVGEHVKVFTNGLQMQYPPNSPAELVTVSGKDQDGCQWRWKEWVPMFFDPNKAVLSNFDYSIESIDLAQVIIPTELGIMIEFHQNGVHYYSDLSNQPLESHFELKNLTVFDNDLYEEVVLAEVDFECKLFAEDGTYVTLKNGEGKIGIVLSQ